jgi:hypothetical protein
MDIARLHIKPVFAERNIPVALARTRIFCRCAFAGSVPAMSVPAMS